MFHSLAKSDRNFAFQSICQSIWIDFRIFVQTGEMKIMGIERIVLDRVSYNEVLDDARTL